MSAARKTPDTDKAVLMLLLHARDFVVDVARVRSTIERMQDAIAVKVKEANSADEKVDSFVLEAFSIDVGWLLDLLEPKTAMLWVELQRQGIILPDRV